jgi:hypothetical protein
LIQSAEDTRNEITHHPIKTLTAAVIFFFFWNGPCDEIIIESSGKFKSENKSFIHY